MPVARGFVAALLAILVVDPGTAATVIWTSNAGGNWSTGSNWSNGFGPVIGDDVVIDRPGASPVITLNGVWADLRSVVSTEAITGSGTIILSAPSSISGSFSPGAMQITTTSTLDISGPLTSTGLLFQGSGTTRATGGISLTGNKIAAMNGHTFVNAGTFTGASAVETGFSLSGGSTLVNTASGVIDWSTSSAITSDGTGKLVNDGILRLSGGTNHAFYLGRFDGAGSLDLRSGALSLMAGAGTYSGTITGEVGTRLYLRGLGNAALEFSGASSFALGASAEVSLSGNLNIRGSYQSATTVVTAGGSASTVAFLGAAPFLGAVVVEDQRLALGTGSTLTIPSLALRGRGGGGTRGGTDVLEVTGLIDWGQGGLVDAGTTNARGGIILRRDDLGGNGHSMGAGHALNNFGTASFVSGSLAMQAGAVLRNAAGALFTMSGEARGIDTSPGAIFINEGTVVASGPGTMSIGARFDNAGITRIDGGVLFATGGGTSAGTFAVAPGAALGLANGFVLAPASSVSAPSGTVILRTNSVTENRILGAFQAATTSLGGYVVSGQGAVGPGNRFVGGAPSVGNLTVEELGHAYFEGGASVRGESAVLRHGSYVRIDSSSALFDSISIPGVGSLEVRSGALQAGAVTIGDRGALYFRGDAINANVTSSGRIDVSGAGTRTLTGDVTTSGVVAVSQADATFVGRFVNTGQYVSTQSTNRFIGEFRLGDSGYLVAGAGSSFEVHGDFINASRQRVLWDTAGAALRVIGGGHHRFELAGDELGADAAGLLQNFAWGHVYIGSGATLDVYDGNVAAGAALYTGLFEMADGIDGRMHIFSAFNIYYDSLLAGNAYLGGQSYLLMGGGCLMAYGGRNCHWLEHFDATVPEPGPFPLATVGGIVVAGLRLRAARRRSS